ncbi:BN159_2729 family protein [Streptomyces sp. enrichment culture]|uniref:BN159_2729 family protein n=1 Tax=Streptomyces sp. enrichment culture TaxID=1795815 RepID=UPI003F57BCF4
MNERPLHAVDGHLGTAYDPLPGGGHAHAADAHLHAPDAHGHTADAALRAVDAHAHPADGFPADGFPEHARAEVRTVSVVRVTVTTCRHEQVLAVALPAAPGALPAGPLEFPAALLPTPEGHLHALPGGGTTAHPATAAAPGQDDARARAREVARTVEREVGTHPDVRGVRADGDTVRVLLRLGIPSRRWDAWCAYFGVTVSGEQPGPRTPAGEGRRDGVRVTVLARGPDGTHEDGADGTAERTYRYGGTAYDLTLPHRDAHGETWYFQGLRTPDGMPLLSVDGRPERCSLANVAEYAGPLTPVRAAPYDDEEQ